MKKYYFLIVLALILGLVLTGCSLLSNISQVPATSQSGITYLTKTLQLPDPGLVGLWHFDEGSGVTTVADSSGNGNTGNVVGATTGVAGNFNNSLSFDGTDDYVQIVNESNFDFERTDAFTLEAWVKTSSDAILNIITKMQNTLPNTGYQLIKHYNSLGNVLYFFLINDYSSGNMIRAYGSTNIADGQWHHVAVTYDGSSDVSGVQIYVDGNAETMGSTENGLADSILNDLSLQISGREGSNYAFSSLIDEVRIWSSALTADQLDDRMAPAITITTPANGATYLLNQVVNADWSAWDDTATGVASESGTVSSGSPIDTTTVGLKNFTVTAADYAKNEDEKTVNYTVIYDWTGFFPPVDIDDLNAAKAGRAIPVKFSLNGDQGLDIFEDGYPKSVEINCDSTDPDSATIEGTETAGGSSLSYDATDDQYIYVWKTDKAWADSCRQLEVKLKDGTSHFADFKFK